MQGEDKIVGKLDILQTTDYGKFKFMTGNRPIEETHVNYLAQKMMNEGNLMDQFPADINDHWFIIDGQHRLLACKKNKMPFYYVIKPETNINTVVSLNTGNRNWSWLNFAQSWSARGNASYTEFIRLWEEFHLNYQVMIKYCGEGSVSGILDDRMNSVMGRFRSGEFKIKDLELTKKLLQQFNDLRDEADFKSGALREFAMAAYGFMRTPDYNHRVMCEKIRQYGDNLLRCYTTADFLIELENIKKT